MFRAPMLNKKDLRNTLESIAINPLLQLSVTEQWKTLPADKISAPRAQLSGRALPYCVFFATATSAVSYCRLKGSFCRSVLYESLLLQTGRWLQVFGVQSITVIYGRHIVSAILKDKKGAGTTFHHFSNFSTMTDINYDGDFLMQLNVRFQMYPSIGGRRRDSTWTRWCYTDMYVPNAFGVSKRPHEKITLYNKKRSKGGGSCEGIVARQPGNRNLRHLKRNGTHVW